MAINMKVNINPVKEVLNYVLTTKFRKSAKVTLSKCWCVASGRPIF